MKFLIFCQNGIFSGGRYYIFFLACALVALGHSVKFVTDKKPSFINNFTSFPNFRRIEWHLDRKCSYEQKGYDFVISVPRKASKPAQKYASMHQVPLYAIMFETPNFTSLYRKGEDSYERFWKGYKEHLNYAKKIITISKESKKYIVEWIKCDQNKVEIINPCINDIEADKVKKCVVRDEIVVISRFLDFKRVDDVLEVIKKLGNKYKINYITSFRDYYGTYNRVLNTAKNYKIPIQVYDNISDKGKFEIIKQSRLLIHPSSFEGFGIPPGEALYMNRPAIVYDLPVYKDFYRDKLIYVGYGNIRELTEATKETLDSKKYISEYFKKKLKFSRFLQDVNKLFVIFNKTDEELTLEEF